MGKKFSATKEFDLPKGLVQKINHACEETLKESIAILMRDAIVAYGNVVDEFYNHYPHPKMYRRKEDLYRGVVPKFTLDTDYYKKFIKIEKIQKKKKNGYSLTMTGEGRIRISSDNLEEFDNNYIDSVQTVFQRFWKQGMHGYETGSDITNKSKKKFFWRDSVPDIPKLSPPPHERFSERFKEIDSPQYKARVSTRIFNENMRNILADL